MPKSSRRHFAKTIAVAAATLPLASTDALAQTPAPQEAETSALATALAGVVRAQHGRHLNSDEMKRIEKDFQDYLPYIARLQDFKLVNSDEPDFTFVSLARR